MSPAGEILPPTFSLFLIPTVKPLKIGSPFLLTSGDSGLRLLYHTWHFHRLDLFRNTICDILIPDSKTTATNKYVAPYLRDGGAGRGTGREPPGARRDDVAAIRISNLSNFAVEADLEDLVKGFGPVQKLYLAKEKVIVMILSKVDIK